MRKEDDLQNVIKLSAHVEQLDRYLRTQDWIKTGETIQHIEVPGDGNMNFTLRVQLADRSFIIKQSRAYVEKYPQVAAPEQRVLQEAAFYNAVAENKVIASQMPQLMAVDRVNNVLQLEDLGNGQDFTFLYQQGSNLQQTELETLVLFAATLHNSSNMSSGTAVIENLEMRKLNHEHIFQYPYAADNRLDLNDICPGLGDVAVAYKNDPALKKALLPLGNRYLETGNTLLHGDFFPGSWLKTDHGIKIIDAEFCHYGYPEFEMGVMMAHLHMANQPGQIVDDSLKLYQQKASLDIDLTTKYMAVEIMRRILGLAQLPLTIDLEKRKELLTMSHQILVN